MRFRRYDPAEFAELYAVEERCFQPPYRFSRSYLREIMASTTSATWVAEQDAIVGFGVVEWSGDSHRLLAYIQTIEVLPECRRTGVASELMRLLEQAAEEAGAELIWLHVDQDNAAAIRLYESHGYLQKGREENYYPRSRAALIYSKELARR